MFGVVEPRFLLDSTAVLEDLDLAASFELDSAIHEAKRVEVLYLAARPKWLSRHTDRHVRVATKRPFLHIAVTDTNPYNKRMQSARVFDCFLSTSQVWFRNDL